jgi:hypothetical protein
MYLNRNLAIITVLSVFAVSGLCAQGFGTSRMPGQVNAGSDSFSVVNNGQRQVYQAGAIPASGLNLKNADMIQTGPSNYVEAQLDVSGAMIKLAENTSVVFNELGTTTRPAMMTLVYGRMRVVNQSGGSLIVVQVGSASVEFSRGDLSLDFAVIPGSRSNQPQLQVSTLAGTAYFVSSPAKVGAKKYLLYEYETVTVDANAELATLNRQPLNKEITAFWSKNGFRQAGGMAAQGAQTAQGVTRSALPPLGAYPAASSSEASFDSGYSDTGAITDLTGGFDTSSIVPLGMNKATLGVKNRGMLMGTILVSAGALVQTAAHFNLFGNENTSDTAFLVGYIPIGVGVTALIATYFYIYNRLAGK